MTVEPTFKIDARAFELEIENMTENPANQSLKQKETDKNYHIESLEKIVGKLISQTLDTTN